MWFSVSAETCPSPKNRKLSKGPSNRALFFKRIDLRRIADIIFYPPGLYFLRPRFSSIWFFPTKLLPVLIR